MNGFKEAKIVIGEVLPRLEAELEEKEEPLTEVQLYHVRRAIHAASIKAWYDAQVVGKEIEEVSGKIAEIVLSINPNYGTEASYELGTMIARALVK